MACPECREALEQEKLDPTGRLWWCQHCVRYFIERNGSLTKTTQVA